MTWALSKVFALFNNYQIGTPSYFERKEGEIESLSSLYADNFLLLGRENNMVSFKIFVPASEGKTFYASVTLKFDIPDNYPSEWFDFPFPLMFSPIIDILEPLGISNDDVRLLTYFNPRFHLFTINWISCARNSLQEIPYIFMTSYPLLRIFFVIIILLRFVFSVILINRLNS